MFDFLFTVMDENKMIAEDDEAKCKGFIYSSNAGKGYIPLENLVN